MKKKFISSITALSLISVSLLTCCQASDKNNIKVTLDGKDLSFDTPPCIINGRTMVPMRTIFEALGASVKWDDSTKTITAVKDNDTIKLSIGGYELSKNNSVSAIDSPAVITDGRTLVPVRAVSDALDVDVEWDAENQTVKISTESSDDDTWKENEGNIDLDTMSVSGSGIFVNDNIINITEGGDFTVTGTLSDGMIHINTKSKVKLRLDNASITNTNGPAIFFENCDKGYITIKKNTENYLSDGENAYTVDAKSVLFSNDDLKISGSGILNITANQNHAIASDDEIEIDEGTIIATSKNDALHANDEVVIANAELNLTSTGDGIQSDGLLTISNSDIDIKTNGIIQTNNNFMRIPFEENNQVADTEENQSSDTSSKGIKAGTTLTVTSGNININSTDHSIHSADKILLCGGDIVINSESGKGVSGHGDVTVNSGNIDIQKATEGIESKAILTINDGSMNITVSDDGLNAGGGYGIGMGSGPMGGGRGGRPPMNFDPNATMNPDGTPPEPPQDGMGGRPPMNFDPNATMNPDGTPPESTQGGMGGRRNRNPMNSDPTYTMNPDNIPTELPQGGMNNIPPMENAQNSSGNIDDTEHMIIINGGYINIDARGDGVDSNGDLIINGGEIIINGPTNGGNSAIDCGDFGSNIILNGGILKSAGFSSMYTNPSDKSAQCSVGIFLSETATDKAVYILDENGNTIIDFSPSKQFECITITTPLLEKGKVYRVYLGSIDESGFIGEFTADSTSTVGTRSGRGHMGRMR